MPRFTRFVSTLLFLSVISLLLPPFVLAQQGNTPILRITNLDTDDFPNVTVFLEGQNLSSNLADLSISLNEDGQEMAITGDTPTQVGTQTAIVFDASGSVLDPGMTGKLRHVEVKEVINRLTGGEEKSWLSDQDWLAIYAPDQEGNVVPIHDWDLDHVGVYNDLYQYEIPPIDTVTQLYDLLFFALDQVVASDVPTHLSRSIVLFSDGYGGESSLEVNDAVDRALKANVVVHAVLLGEGMPETIGNMKRISTLTGGTYVQLASTDSLDILWDGLVSKGQQRQLSYRSPHPNPREIVALGKLPDGDVLQAVKPFPAITLSPVEVKLIEPAGEVRITKEAPAHDSELQELEPKVLPLKIELTWPEGERTLSEVEYTINDNTKIRNEPPFDQFDFPIDDLDTGSYTIRVMVTDELGLTSQSPPVSFRVQVNRPDPPAPPPPPPPTVTIVGMEIEQENFRTLISLLALLLAILAVIIALRNPRRRKQVTEAFGAVVKQVTQPFMLNQDTFQPKPVKAILQVVEGDGKLPAIIEIKGANTKIGRSHELANIVIDDPRVSRYHCRITEETDGSFRIWDEGSTSGTYVNFDSIDIKSGQILATDDLINVGPIQFRFQHQTTNEPDHPEDNEPDHPEEFEYQPNTEPLQKKTTVFVGHPYSSENS